jgi:uncharacterized protein (TIGR02466 family)
MRMPLHTLDFFMFHMKDWETKKQKLSKYVNDIDYKERRDENDLLRFSTDRYSDRSYMEDFIEIIDDELRQFGNDLNVEGFNIEDIWSVKYNKGDYHSVHTHGSTNWSGVLYYQFDPSEHSGTHFIVENVNQELNSTMIRTPNVDEGVICIFPSDILHFTTPNMSDKQRIIFSFDITTGKRINS